MTDLFGTLEKNKQELSLSINSFDNPTNLLGVKAWSQLMLNLTFLRKGTYPSQPEMGIDIQSYEYEYLDEAVQQLAGEILDQQQKYLPDIPLIDVTVTTTEYKGSPVLLINYIFREDNRNVASAVAIDMASKDRKFLDFDISWENN